MKNLGGCDRTGVNRNFRQGGADRAGSVVRDGTVVVFVQHCGGRPLVEQVMKTPSDMDTKKRRCAILGNDATGFVRVSHRRLKRTTSASFDLVRAFRINGKPRHEFVLGLGSQKDNDPSGASWFWLCAIHRMKWHGLSEPQRHRLIAEMVRKGAQLPDERDKSAWRDEPELKEVLGSVRLGRPEQMTKRTPRRGVPLADLKASRKRAARANIARKGLGGDHG